MKDILTLEQIQRRATKNLLNDYTTTYKTRLLMYSYLFKLQDYQSSN